MGTAGDQLAFHQGKTVTAAEHFVIGLAAFGAGLGGIGDEDPVLLGIFKKIALQATLSGLGRAFHDRQVALVHLPVFDLLIQNPQGLCRLGSDDDAAGIAVDTVAQGGGEGILLPGAPFPLLIKIGLDMVDEGSAILSAVMGMNRQARALIGKQNMLIFIDDIQLRGGNS